MSPRAIQIRKQDLAIALQKVKTTPNPKVGLEQYTIPADLAAEILFIACYVHGDIQCKQVVDLGTGTGRLALGASILGADYVVGVDIDAESLKVASKAEKLLDAKVDFVHGRVDTVHGPVDTVLMNPPFGTKKAHADIQFLEHALRIGNIVYSIHKSSTREFLELWLSRHSFEREQIAVTQMDIPHQFRFHRKPKRPVDVDVIRVTRR